MLEYICNNGQVVVSVFTIIYVVVAFVLLIIRLPNRGREQSTGDYTKAYSKMDEALKKIDREQAKIKNIHDNANIVITEIKSEIHSLKTNDEENKDV